MWRVLHYELLPPGGVPGAEQLSLSMVTLSLKGDHQSAPQPLMVKVGTHYNVASGVLTYHHPLVLIAKTLDPDEITYFPDLNADASYFLSILLI